MPSYVPNYEPGDQVIIEQKYHTILDVEDKEYQMTWKGRFRWKDARDIDAISKPANSDA